VSHAENHRIRAVVLDVDGTVVTCPIDFGAMRRAVEQAANRWSFDVKSLGVRGIIEQIRLAAEALQQHGSAFQQEAEGAVIQMEVDAAKAAHALPGAADALAQLRRDGYAVALITRNCRAASQVVLRELREYDVLLSRDDVPRPKPDPDHVHRGLSALGFTADQAVMVGDHGFDMEAGRAAGVRLCIGVRTGGSTDASLIEAGADVVLDSLAEIPDWLRRYREPGP
jgi:phosphoglycolate phosphatase